MRKFLVEKADVDVLQLSDELTTLRGYNGFVQNDGGIYLIVDDSVTDEVLKQMIEDHRPSEKPLSLELNERITLVEDALIAMIGKKVPDAFLEGMLKMMRITQEEYDLLSKPT